MASEIDTPRGRSQSADLDRLICHCMVVSEREVIACIRAGARTVDEVAAECGAGSGCGSCRGGIQVIFAEERVRRRKSAAQVPEAVLAQLGLFGPKGGGSHHR